MATQEISSRNGIQNISIPRRNTHIKIAKENGSRLLTSRSILSIANSMPCIFQVFSLPLLKIKNFTLGSTSDSSKASHEFKRSNAQANKKQTKRRTEEGLWDRSDPFTVRQGERIAQRADLTNSTQGIYPGLGRTDV